MGDSLFDVFRTTLMQHGMYNTFHEWAKSENLLPTRRMFRKIDFKEEDQKLVSAVKQFAQTDILTEDLKSQILSSLESLGQ